MKNAGLLDRLMVYYQLKEIKRTGWMDVGISDAESIADHSFMVALLAILLIDEHDPAKNKLIQMALVHDLAESITGDIVWQKGHHKDRKKKEEKDRKEREAMQLLLKITPTSTIRQVKELVLEYIEQETIDARKVKELDKLEMCIQAMAYADRMPREEIQSFLKSAQEYIFSDAGIRLYEEIVDRINKGDNG